MMMAYKNDSLLTIISRYGKADSALKVELYETWDRMRDLMTSGASLGGSGLGGFSSFLMNVGRTFGTPAFQPILGSESINVPGTSYYAPISGGTGIVPGGQASFGIAPFSYMTGIPTAGGAASLGALSPLVLAGLGQSQAPYAGFGDTNFPAEGLIGGAAPIGQEGISPFNNSSTTLDGTVVGGAITASGLTAPGTAGATAIGMGAGLGFGRNWTMPAASLLSGVGGLLTTLGPLFGPIGLAGVGLGGILNGVAGSMLSGFQQVNQRILANADTVLSEKVRNIEAVSKMLGVQKDLLSKMLKDTIDSDKKALDNL
jgi:hypothetical protein